MVRTYASGYPTRLDLLRSMACADVENQVFEAVGAFEQEIPFLFHVPSVDFLDSEPDVTQPLCTQIGCFSSH